MSESFVRLVAAMRQAQVRYFKDRTHIALKEAKRLEAEVDAQLQSLLIQSSHTQSTIEWHIRPDGARS